MTDKELQDFIKHGETGFVEFAMVFGDGWARHAIEIAKELRARLAQPEPQETISKWIKANTEHREWYICPKCSYQAPRFKDEWQGLTDDEVAQAMYRADAIFTGPMQFKFAKEIEAKLKEKNT